MKAYKVVRRGKNGWESCCVDRLIGGVTYRTRRTTRRPKNGGPLCVFSNKASALAFASIDHSGKKQPLVVFRCEYTPCPNTYRVWTDTGVSMDSYSLPWSTRLAESVTLIERIK